MARSCVQRSLLAWVLLATSILASCTTAEPISRALRGQIEQSPDETLRITDFADFEWQRFVVFGPYTTRSMVDEVLGFPWLGYGPFVLEKSDRFTLLVFIDQDAVVHAEKHPRCRPDFATEVLGRPLTPTEAVFSVDWADEGCPIGRIVE